MLCRKYGICQRFRLDKSEEKNAAARACSALETRHQAAFTGQTTILVPAHWAGRRKFPYWGSVVDRFQAEIRR